MVIAVSATGIAVKTPAGPQLKVLAINHAIGIWKNQNPKRFTHVGVRVSPAPLNALDITMPMP